VIAAAASIAESHLGLLLAVEQDRGAQVDVQNDEHLAVTGLEEQMLHIAEQQVCGGHDSSSVRLPGVMGDLLVLTDFLPA
jgi:hypothetical protein